MSANQFRGICGAFALVCLAAGPAAGLSPARATPSGDAAGPSAAVPRPLLSETDRAIYARALRLAEAQRFDEARALGRTASDPLLGKVVLWLDLATPRKDDDDFPIIAAFLTKNPDWPGRGALQLHAEMVLPKDLPDARVLAWFAVHAPLSAEGAARYAEALIRAGERDRAIELVRATWLERIFPGTEEVTFLASFGAFLREEDHVARLDRLLWSRAHGSAMRQAQRLGPGHRALAEARLRLAGNRPGIDSAVARVPATLSGDLGLIYERARWRQRQGRYEDVIALLDPPAAEAPLAERWWPLRHWAVRQALVKGDISVAYRIASHHGMTSGIGFAEAEWLSGWIALRFLEQPDAAYRHFARLHGGVSSPISLGRGAFWAGEAARGLATRDSDDRWSLRARQWYEIATAHDTSFYGQLASLRLGRGPEIDLTAHDAPSAQTRQAFESSELVRIVRMLGELDERPLMERFLARLQVLAETGKDYALVAELAGWLGRPDLAMRTARIARSEGLVLPAHLFPSMALPQAEPPELALMLALIRQESAFYAEAVSRSGARGLMQIMPNTARQVARQIKTAYNGDKLLSDPQYNILLGRTYLSELLERYRGSYVLALAAYNAGPSRIDRWIETFGDPRDSDVDIVDWIESIPFDETRNYVQRILESLIAYRQRLGTAPDVAPGLPELRPLAIADPVAPSAAPPGAAPDGNLSCCL